MRNRELLDRVLQNRDPVWQQNYRHSNRHHSRENKSSQQHFYSRAAGFAAFLTPGQPENGNGEEDRSKQQRDVVHRRRRQT